MTLNECQELQMRTLNPRLTSREMLVNAALGLSGESGEVADLVKKHLFQGHDLDTNEIIKEAGDCLWYVSLAAKACGVTLEELAKRNIDKLAKRYSGQIFDPEKSKNRKE